MCLLWNSIYSFELCQNYPSKTFFWRFIRGFRSNFIFSKKQFDRNPLYSRLFPSLEPRIFTPYGGLACRLSRYANPMLLKGLFRQPIWAGLGGRMEKGGKNKKIKKNIFEGLLHTTFPLTSIHLT